MSVLSIVEAHTRDNSAIFILNNLRNAMLFETREELWAHCCQISESQPSETGLDAKAVILEFGVWQGESLRYFANRFSELSLFGFDSFEGLSENWTGTRLSKGFFDLNGKLPEVPDNVTLIKGWFSDTLSDWLNQNSVDDISIRIVHLDADTYEPTFFVLKCLGKRLSKGTIVIFDEFLGYPNWENHEYRALLDFTNFENLDYSYIGFTNRQAAILIN